MSMEAALDEERRSVLALLEGSAQAPRAHKGPEGPAALAARSGRTSSPLAGPRSPVRSMLDIAEESAPRHHSIAATSGGILNTTRSPVRSMLDIGAPAPAPVRSMLDVGTVTKAIHSVQTSPIESSHKHRASLNSVVHPRSMSDVSQRPVNFGSRALPERTPKGDLTSEYQFSNIFTSNSGAPTAPKRNTLAGKKLGIGASSDVMKGSDLSSLSGLDRGRHQSIAGTGIGAGAARKSMSPHNQLGFRSNSPHSGLLGTSVVNSSSKYTLDNGTPIDMNNAFRRLSDANLALVGGSFAALSGKAQRRRTDSGDDASAANARLVKDYSYAEDENVVESSDDEHQQSSDEERQRGRKKSGREANDNHPEAQTIGMGRAKGPRQALSLMAAAEEERQQIAQQHAKKYKVRSLLDPEITVTGPGGERLRSSKPGIHPTTAFDHGGGSGLSTPLDSDTEAEITDIKRAQKLSVVMTSISSTPETSRCVRTIYRGDFVEMQKEAAENHRRVRKYLVATDLSDEAQHALEWTIGTVLRDGDTLLAIYCVDEETGIPRPDGEPMLASDSATLSAQAATIAAATNKLQTPAATTPAGHGMSPLGGTQSNTASPVGRARSAVEQERIKAVQDITDRVTKLLRKTRLQVRVVIEVIHCKSPKHLITEVIDFLSPTLVILGSRGRSALKGVILGSFSNYLVTKSSVPVMVARKKLRKHTKYKRPSVRLANNLTAGGRGLLTARVDEL